MAFGIPISIKLPTGSGSRTTGGGEGVEAEAMSPKYLNRAQGALTLAGTQYENVH